MERFQLLSKGVSRIYKQMQRLKKEYMGELGMKGTHVMCLYYLSRYPGGLTAAELCELCGEDKAGISRILSELEQGEILRYDFPEGKKRYRAKALLTEYGQGYALEVTRRILEVTERAGQGISREEREIFYRVLGLIADNLDEMGADLEKKERGQ